MKKLLALLLMAALALGCVPAMADYVLVEGQNAEGLFGNPLQAIQVAFVKQVDEEATDKSAGFPYAAFQVFGLTNAEVRTFMRAQDGAVDGGTVIAVVTEDGKIIFYIRNSEVEISQLPMLMHTFTDPDNRSPYMDNFHFRWGPNDPNGFLLNGEGTWLPKPAEEENEDLIGMWEFPSLGTVDIDGNVTDFDEARVIRLPIFTSQLPENN